MSNSYSTLCDDFGTSTYLMSKIEMPTSRETVLHFFEAIQKTYPSMTDFEKRDNGEFALEEDRETGAYRWSSLDTRRLCAGYVNPPAMDDADEHNEKVLEMAAYHLDLGKLGHRGQVSGARRLRECQAVAAAGAAGPASGISSGISSRRRRQAEAAASCSASFLLRPLPSP